MNSTSPTPLDPAEAIRTREHPMPEDPEGFARWQRVVRRRLAEISGLTSMGSTEGLGEVRQIGEPVILKDHRRTDLELRTQADYWLPVYLLEPLGQAARNTVLLAFHGHGRGREEVAGVTHGPDDEARIERLNYDYGLKAVRQGYAVFVPEMRGFGERSIGEDSCRRLNFSAINAGLSLKGLHTWDAMRLVDYVKSRPDFSEKRLGAIGLSGGGGSVLWLAALDTRVEFAVISAFLKSYGVENQGCMCNLVPGQLKIADRGEMAALIVPRPLWVQTGKKDTGGPLPLVQDAFNVAQKAADLHPQASPPVLEIHEQGHRWSDAGVWEWIAAGS